MKIIDEEKKTSKLDDWVFEHIPRFLYRMPANIRSAYYEVKYAFQFVFRKNHISDRQVWNIGYYIIDYVYPRIKAFIESERNGYPAIFSEYEENSGWKNKEEYDQAIKDGKMLGGEKEAWDNILNEILFACEYTVHTDNKEIKGFYENWGLEDPHEKKESNKTESYFKKGEFFYYNVKLDMKYKERAQKGFELLGKYLLNLWD